MDETAEDILKGLDKKTATTIMGLAVAATLAYERMMRENPPQETVTVEQFRYGYAAGVMDAAAATARKFGDVIVAKKRAEEQAAKESEA